MTSSVRENVSTRKQAESTQSSRLYHVNILNPQSNVKNRCHRKETGYFCKFSSSLIPVMNTVLAARASNIPTNPDKETQESSVKQVAISSPYPTSNSHSEMVLQTRQAQYSPQLTKTKHKKLYQCQNQARLQQPHQNRMTYYMSYAAQSQLEPILLSKPKLRETRIRTT